MPMHIGATLGLIVGGIATAIRTHRAYVDSAANMEVVADTFQSCFSGYSWRSTDAWKVERMVFTIPAAVGGGMTWVAIKTGYNSWTPKGANL